MSRLASSATRIRRRIFIAFERAELVTDEPSASCSTHVRDQLSASRCTFEPCDANQVEVAGARGFGSGVLRKRLQLRRRERVGLNEGIVRVSERVGRCRDRGRCM